jgi:uncharacterized protein YndB with AHSA1/START domain
MQQAPANPMTLTLASDREIAITRLFDAPRSLVWEAFHRCEHLASWWGPRGFELVECSIDLRPGGGYRFVQKAPDGSIHPFHGIYREVQEPERVVATQVYEPIPGAEMTNRAASPPTRGCPAGRSKSSTRSRSTTSAPGRASPSAAPRSTPRSSSAGSSRTADRASTPASRAPSASSTHTWRASRSSPVADHLAQRKSAVAAEP